MEPVGESEHNNDPVQEKHWFSLSLVLLLPVEQTRIKFSLSHSWRPLTASFRFLYLRTFHETTKRHR